MNIIFKKRYLFVLVIMAANIFVVNEMRATAEEKAYDQEILEANIENIKDLKNLKELNLEEIKKREGQEVDEFNQEQKKQAVQDFFDRLLSWENYVNFFGALALSGANNYLKWWDYNPGTYCKFVWFGWRSKKLLNDIFQFEVNLNVIRGVLWLIPGSLFFVVQGYSKHKINTACSFTFSLLLFLTINNGTVDAEIEKKHHIKVMAFLLSILQGFVSAPLTLHLSIFSIAISLDAILWELVAIWARKKVYEIHKKGLEHAIKKDEND